MARTVFILAGILAALCGMFAAQAALIHRSSTFILNSQRNVLNIDSVANYDYAFINMIQQGDGSVGPVGSAFAATTSTFMQLIDANGWPNNSGASGHAFGGSVRMPSSGNFAGPYVVTWTGDATVSFSGISGTGGTCTETNNTGTTYTRNSNCNWTSKAGQTAYIVMNVSGITNQLLAGWSVTCTGTTCNSGSTGFLTNLKIYRQADETDLLAGKVFRTAFKQTIVNHDPSFLRFMNWHGGNSDFQSRWENRTTPNVAGYAFNSNYVASPPYGAATGVNQYVLGAVSTGGNQTPAAATHGSLVTARMGSACSGGGSVTVTAIQNQNIPQVTVSSAIPFAQGDTLVFRQSNAVPAGIMTKLNYFPVTINTVIDTTHFTINADTTTWGALSGTVLADEFISLNVGAQGAFPVIFLNGTSPACHFGTYISANDYKSFVFNKNVSAKTDGAGNWIYGVWLFNDLGSNNGYSGDVPIEICVALVNEVNALAASQGVNHPINMWINVPYMGLLSIDPDYQLSSNYAVQMTNTILNGANGYAGLTAAAFVLEEYSNETWNTGGSGFSQTPFLEIQGFQRWPASGITDTTDMVALRSTAMARDVRANATNISRVKFAISGQGFAAFSTNGANHGRVYGNVSAGQAGNYYTTDTLVVSGGWGTPISNHDAFATASYFDPPNTYYSVTTGTGTFTDDSAMYNGTDNSGNGGGNYTGVANPTQAIVNYVAQVNGASSCASQSIQCYVQTLRPAYASGLPVGKPSIEYEGGTDWPVKAGAATFGPTLTSAMAAFSVAVTNSSQWSTAQTGYFNSVAAIANAASPSIYIWIAGTSSAPPGDQRWGYCSPDDYASGIEGQALLNNPFWNAAGVRNQSLNFLLKRDFDPTSNDNDPVWLEKAA